MSNEPVNEQSKYHKGFAKVLWHELEQVKRRREVILEMEGSSPSEPDDSPEGEKAMRNHAHRLDLFGVAFSGGGIRSGTFNLGILQALASTKLLKHVDYLSTVSGGGYIHGWLAAWLQRETQSRKERKLDANDERCGQMAVENTELQLNPSRLVQSQADRLSDEEVIPKGRVYDEEPEPIRHLRGYSRFLTPAQGIFSLDTWALVAIYIRNTFMNLLAVIPILMALIYFLHIGVILYGSGSLSNMWAWSDQYAFMYWEHRWDVIPVLLAALPMVLAYVVLGRGLWNFRAEPDEANKPLDRGAGWRSRLLLFILVFLSAFITLYIFGGNGSIEKHSRVTFQEVMPESMSSPQTFEQSDIFNTMGPYGRAALIYGIIGLVGAIIARCFELCAGRFQFVRGLWQTGVTLLYGLLLGLMVWTIIDMLNFAIPFELEYCAERSFVLGVPLYLLAVVFAGYVEVALNESYMLEPEREWRSRMAGYFMVFALSWTVLTASVFYLPNLFQNNVNWAGATWLLGVVAAYFAQRSSQSAPRFAQKGLRLISVIAPIIILLGAVGLSAYAAEALLKYVRKSAWAEEMDIIVTGGIALLFGLFGVLMLLSVRVSTFSLHALYENRLIRCYLGASRHNHRWKSNDPDADRGAPTGVDPPPRRANEFTDFDPSDDFSLVKLRLSQGTNADNQVGYYGPYPLFNTTLNLVAGSIRSEADRKGESFVLSPDYCGNPRTGYARLPERSKDETIYENLTLGRAVTISGAAIDPNMRNFQSAPFTALLTLLNLRLGWWIENPLKLKEKWKAENPRTASQLLQEFLGRTQGNGDYIHLSDGGHFENTGAYELIRRRCGFIVVVDAAEDANDASENLANLIRLVRTDFGIRITIDTTPLHKDADGLSNTHVAVGVIRYDDVDYEGVNGTLIFIRSSMTGDEPADLKNYAITNPEFPHHPTLDQFFNEEQFESYRMLGFHIGYEVFVRAATEAHESSDSKQIEQFNRKLFAALRQEWQEQTTDQSDRYIDAMKPWTLWSDAMRKDDHLLALNEDIYPELGGHSGIRMMPNEDTTPKTEATKPVNDVAEYWSVAQMMGVMETAWMRMKLDQAEQPDLHRGWINCFQRWTASKKFHHYWPMLRLQYSKGFIRFCETVLHVPTVPQQATLWSETLRKSIKTELGKEFDNEVPRKDRTLENRIDNIIGKPNAPLWVIFNGPLGEESRIVEKPSDELYPIGIVGVNLNEEQASGAKNPSGSHYYELLYWIRPGYRDSDAGHELLTECLVQIEASIPNTQNPNAEQYIVVRIPKNGQSLAQSLQRAGLTQFFNDHDFFPYQLEKGESKEIRLRKKVQSNANR